MRQTKRKKNSRKKKQPLSTVQIIIFTVIIVTIITVIVSIVIIPFLKPENIIKNDTETLASNYYENYFYEKLTSSKNFSGNAEKVLKKYKERGLAIVRFRQLTSYGSGKYPDKVKTIKDSCDENRSYVIFYPEPPYEKTSYHIDYSYACNF